MRPLLFVLLLSASLSGCLDGSSAPASPDGGEPSDPSEPSASEPRVHEVQDVVTLVGAPDPVLRSGGVGAGFSGVATDVRVREGAARVIVEVEWSSPLPFRIVATPPEDVVGPVGVREEPAHVAPGPGGSPGHARLVVDDPEPGTWGVDVWPDGAAYEVPATLRYVVLYDDRDMDLF